MKKTTLYIDVVYDDTKITEDSVMNVLTIVLSNALSTPDLLDEYGEISVSEFYTPEVLNQ